MNEILMAKIRRRKEKKNKKKIKIEEKNLISFSLLILNK